MQTNYTYNDLIAHAAGKFQGVSEAGLALVATGCLAFVQGVYWQEPNKEAKDVREEFTEVCQAAGKKAGSQKDYATLAMLLARHMVKTFGKGTGTVPNAATDSVSAGTAPIWQACQSSADVQEAVAHIVIYIGTDLGCRTVRELRNAISKPGKPATKKSFVDRTYDAAVKGLEDGSVNVSEIHETIDRLRSILTVKPLADIADERRTGTNG